MKKITLIIMCLGAFLFGNAQEVSKGIKFEASKFDQVLTKAKADDKLVFLNISTSWCPPCKRMAKDVFPMESVGNYFNKNFVNLKVDAEKGEGIALAKRYKITGYPTFLLLNSSGDVVGRLVGGAAPNDFIAKIEALRVNALKK